jgi:hypothetical protein
MTIQLKNGKYGWNQIASPYTYPVAWNGPALWRWDNAARDFVSDENVLMPWQGYWVNSADARNVGLTPTPLFGAAAQPLAKKRLAYSVERNDWQVQIVLARAAGGDADNRLGFSPRASDGYNPLFNRAEPPRMGGEPYLFFTRREWQGAVTEFAADIRKNFKTVNTFTVGIAPSATSAPCTLRVDGAEELPGVYLFIADADTVVPFNSQNPQIVAAGKQTQYRTIFATDQKDFLANYPRAFAMAKPYPNPMRPQAHLGYVLPYRFENNGIFIQKPYAVSMVVYDARGRVIKTLVNRTQAPGRYTLVWDGKSANGQRVASGSYVCMLKADSFTANVKLVMLY